MDLFTLNQFVKNIRCKLSTTTEYNAKKQILCVVTELNDIFLHFTSYNGFDVVKVLKNFRSTTSQQQSHAIIIDVCFDPTSDWLLILCKNNTLHIVPVFKIFDNFLEEFEERFSSKIITTFKIPDIDEKLQLRSSPSVEQDTMKTKSNASYPTASIWWKSINAKDHAIIGYSDGYICFLEFEPVFRLISIVRPCYDPISKLSIYKESGVQNVILLITSSTDKQWKLVLEKKCLCYIFTDDMTDKIPSDDNQRTEIDETNKQEKINEKNYDDLLFENQEPGSSTTTTTTSFSSSAAAPAPPIPLPLDHNSDDNSKKLLPSAKAKLESLKILGSKKISSIIQKKMSETKRDSSIDESDDSKKYASGSVNPPGKIPELLNRKNNLPADVTFQMQNLRNINLLSAFHKSTNALSVHRMDTIELPMFWYRLPINCCDTLITSNLLYTIHCNTNQIEQTTNQSNATTTTSTTTDETIFFKKQFNVSIISSALASIKNEHVDVENYDNGLLSSFTFETDEEIINIHRKLKYCPVVNQSKLENDIESKQNTIENSNDYYYYYKGQPNNDENDANNNSNAKIFPGFPTINYDPCYIITNRNLYFIDMKKEAQQILLDLVMDSLWNECEKFCKIFDISFTKCLEIIGDYLLRTKKINHALLTFNVAKMAPVQTALKLAMHRENFALMHLCAMALNHNTILNSKYCDNFVLKSLMNDLPNSHAEDVLLILPRRKSENEIINTGEMCSYYKYKIGESINSMQLPLNQQFHISNLLLITLAEKAVRDKNYIDLWNFLATNSKYHTNMTSIVLAQSGLYSSVIVLAITRGCVLDSFIALCSVLHQEFGYYKEYNICLYNLSNTIFSECLIYLPDVSEEYFQFIQNKILLIKSCVLNRLTEQFCPFSSIFRSILYDSSSSNSAAAAAMTVEKCSSLIETYLTCLIQINKLEPTSTNNFLNAFSTFNSSLLSSNENDNNEMKLLHFSPISVGYSHCSCVFDGNAYFWGSNGIHSILNIKNISDMNEPVFTVKPLDLLKDLNLIVYAVKCGRQHTIILTNNGIFTLGSNQYCQLGIGKRIKLIQHPVLVGIFDQMNISILEAGQYHNAVVANDNLYTWGWGLHGQLGHGNIENVSVPKIVNYFKNKKIKSVALGHAHSLVLCNNNNNELTNNLLYVFGSNHFGQLGIGGPTNKNNNTSGGNITLKGAIPILLEFGENIQMIHTKFFSNVVVNDKNEIFIWGTSPQALRLANQSKGRRSMRQNLSDSIKKEISKRMGNSSSDIIKDSKNNQKNEQSIQISEKLTEVNSTSSVNENTQNNDEILTNKDSSLECKEQQQTNSSSKRGTLTAPENIDHTIPYKTNTDNVSGEILNISSGLFHFALVSSEHLLYTWGRNFEHQLGIKETKFLNTPTLVDSIVDAEYVACGADFTVVLSRTRIVKAFGSNVNGQCGQDLQNNSSTTDLSNQKRLYCLPTTKRFLRLQTNSIEIPSEIVIPHHKTNEIEVMKWKKNLKLSLNNSGNESTEIIMENKFLNIENIHYNKIWTSKNSNNWNLNHFIHYCLVVFHGLYNDEKISNLTSDNIEYKIRILLLNSNLIEAFKLCLLDCRTAQQTITIFEHFTKELPIIQENLAIFIYFLLNHFVLENFDLVECEKFLLSNLNNYLIELFFVIYFNSSNYVTLTYILNRKLKSAFNIQNVKYSTDKIDLIFEKLSINFKTIVCNDVISLIKANKKNIVMLQ